MKLIEESEKLLVKEKLEIGMHEENILKEKDTVKKKIDIKYYEIKITEETAEKEREMIGNFYENILKSKDIVRKEIDEKCNEIQVKEGMVKVEGEIGKYDEMILKNADLINAKIDIKCYEVEVKEEMIEKEEGKIRKYDEMILKNTEFIKAKIDIDCNEMQVKKEIAKNKEAEIEKYEEKEVKDMDGVKKEIDIKDNEIHMDGYNDLIMQSKSHNDHVPLDENEGGRRYLENCGIPPYESFCNDGNSDSCQSNALLDCNKYMNICKACDVLFTSKQSLNDHMMSHCSVTDKRYRICGRKKTYKLHYSFNKHDNLQRKMQFVCDVCHNFFTTMSKLYDHMITHGSIKKSCDDCGKLMESNYLHYHFQTDSTDKIFTCNICNVSFPTRKQIIYHLFHLRSHSYSFEKVLMT